METLRERVWRTNGVGVRNCYARVSDLLLPSPPKLQKATPSLHRHFRRSAGREILGFFSCFDVTPLLQTYACKHPLCVMAIAPHESTLRLDADVCNIGLALTGPTVTIITDYSERGKFFCLRLVLFYLQVSFFAYSPLRCLVGALYRL